MARFTLTRDSFIPAGFQAVQDPQSSAIAYIGRNSKDRPRAVMFSGKAAKPARNFWYHSTAALERDVVAFFQSVRSAEARKVQRREARKAEVNSYAVGDVLYSMWGYDQTNVEWFEIVAVSGSMLTLRQIAAETTETAWAQGRSVPVPGKYIGEPMRRRASNDGIRIHGNFAYARKAAFKEVAGVRVYESKAWTAYA